MALQPKVRHNLGPVGKGVFPDEQPAAFYCELIVAEAAGFELDQLGSHEVVEQPVGIVVGESQKTAERILIHTARVGYAGKADHKPLTVFIELNSSALHKLLFIKTESKILIAAPLNIFLSKPSI
jgi:hypothetical protein